MACSYGAKNAWLAEVNKLDNSSSTNLRSYKSRLKAVTEGILKGIERQEITALTATEFRRGSDTWKVNYNSKL